MDPSKPAQEPPPLPPRAAPPQPPPRPPQPQPQKSSKRRALDPNVRIQASPYYKMRSLLNDLRPSFIEVLATPDFRNCRAAQEIKEKLKLFMELYGQMTASAETISSTKRNNVKEGKRVKGENQDTEKRQAEVLEARGTYIVGGSAFGWNFITFPGHKPEYYGPTKELFRASRVELQEKRTASVLRTG
ncbi:hypothetical protein EUGRSUZ_E00158 [Eucalyptus grandis]|uniref:Uncharacterized protein n=2 Tax=Eucalyptus grandis TaxID=71139 RepID=A0ACC3KR44_EUCGR|nr:hypothetical protein EUGRSUZ_E00158 [Eucalyptus grandis]